ncbi:glycosyltransferase [Poseidonocella sp. HB161398]|uniref:glycosyltransferase n=1 Tax=Poseidonocella sp. HB161398 TaxID=2320855 RepID=UPI0011082D18|nr:glycosyltransferase [Poseidonocella sp. HB161398]
MIRVAFGSVPKDGGTFTFYRNMRPALLPHGIDLRCVAAGPAQAALWEDSFADEGCVLLAARSDSLKAQARAFADWCEAEEIDIVFGVNSPAILSALPHLPGRIRAMARCANGFDEGYRLTMMGRERLAKVVALVPRLRDDLIADYGADPARIALIPNGASPERFEAAARAERGRGARLELGFLGRLEHGQKGVLHLPPVLERLDAAGIAYRLSIAGKGKHEPELRSAMAAHIEDGRVRFTGTLTPDEIPGFLEGVDCFLFPSHFEGCPNALLEAMMAGAVPVSWCLPGITDFLLKDGETGLLSPVGDVDGFAASIVALAGDRARTAQMSRAVAASARAEFSVEACRAAYVALFGEVMADAPPAWTPRPWSRFETDPLFRPRPLARLIPARQRRMLRSMSDRLLKQTPAPAAPRPAPGTAPRVHQIVNSFGMDRGGAERLARGLHVALRARGVDARLVALEACDTGGLEGATSFGFASPYDPRALLRLGAYAREIAPGDIVHVHLFPAIAHVAALARLGRMPGRLVFTEHNSSNRRRAHPLGGVIDDQVYRPFERIVTISVGVAEELSRARPWLADRTVVIENGCHLAFGAPPERPETAAPVILSVGRLAEQKNYPVALEALAGLGDVPFRYVVAGDGPERAALERQADALGLGDRTTFAGHVADVPALLAEADIFLMPSKWEGFGLAAAEAMNAGLPVIAADVPGLREVAGPDGEAALLVDPADPEDVGRALSRLLGDRQLRAELGRAGFERAGRYDFARFVSDHLHLYRKLGESPADAA